MYTVLIAEHMSKNIKTERNEDVLWGTIEFAFEKMWFYTYFRQYRDMIMNDGFISSWYTMKDDENFG